MMNMIIIIFYLITCVVSQPSRKPTPSPTLSPTRRPTVPFPTRKPTTPTPLPSPLPTSTVSICDASTATSGCCTNNPSNVIITSSSGGTITSFRFQGCTNFKIVTISTTIHSIGSSAFDSCSNLVEVTISNVVTSIGNGIFAKCTSLESVSIGTRITTLSDNMFTSCSSLTSIVIPTTITTIGDFVFQNSGIQEINVPTSVTSIGNGILSNCISLTTAIIPSSVASLGIETFKSCINLDNVAFIRSSIPDGTFANCTSLSNLTVGSSVVFSVGAKAFEDCSKMSTFSFSALRAIGSRAFYKSALISVTLPISLITVGSECFSDNYFLTTAVVYGSTIAASQFANCKLLSSLTLGVGVTTIDANAFLSTLVTCVNWDTSITRTISTSAFPSGANQTCPTPSPTASPSSVPSSNPSRQPSSLPSSKPSRRPSSSPSRQPSSKPSSQPSSQPLSHPSSQPSSQPLSHPSSQPSSQPSNQPSSNPTSPTSQPTSIPSQQPTSQPSLYCNIGSYIKQTGNVISCEKCENGYMSTTVRATACAACAAGTYSDFTTLKCVDCTIGYFSTEGSNECQACPIGFYSDTAGAPSCNACPAGRTTALIASVSAASCQSPATSFAFGIVGLFVAIAMIVNVVSSRFHITSFVRRIRIVDPICKTCKTLMIKLDSIKRAMFIHKFEFMKEEELGNLSLPPHLRTLHNIGKMFLMMIAMLLLLLILMMIFFGQYLLRIFYQTFVLWRGLRFNFSLNPDFLSIMNTVLAQLAAVIDVPFINEILLVFYPIIIVLAKLADFHLNLSSVNVSCSGSQAPLEVMINVVILGLFAVYIESNYQVLIAAPVAEILRSSIEIVMFYKSRTIMEWSFFRWFLSLVYLGIIRMLLSLKPMASSLQYLMSFVSVQTFVPFHTYSDACNNIAQFVGIDSALANLSTALIYCLIAPVIYTVACVVVPGLPSSDITIPVLGAITKSHLFDRDHFYFANDEKNQWRERYKCFYRIYSAVKTLMSPDVMFMFIFAFQNVHILVNQAEEILGLKSIIDGLKDSSNRYHDDKIVLANIMTVRSIDSNAEPSSQNSSSRHPSSPYKSSRFKGHFFSISEDDLDDDNMNHDNNKPDVNELRRNFSRKKSSNMDTQINIENNNGFIKVGDDSDANDSDIFSYGKLSRSFSRMDSKSWTDVGTNVAKAKVDEVIVLTSFCVDELKVAEVNELKKIKSTIDRFPSYYTLSRWTLQDLWEFWECNDVNVIVEDNNDDASGAFNNVTMTTNSVNSVSDESKHDKGINYTVLLNAIKLYLKRATVILFSFTFFGHLSTETGRSAYITIFWKAYIMMKVSFGFWNDDCMEAFDADKSFTEMVLGDTDEKNMGDTLEAIVGIRSVLFQLLPGLTLLSVYVQNTSRSPIFVTNKRLLESVPSFLMSFSQARELAIEVELRRIGEHHSQVDKYKEYNIQEWTITMLTLNIFITKCRFVDYCIGALSVAMSISVVFGTATSNLDTNSTVSFIKTIVLVLLVIYVPYSFFLSLQYLVIFGKILHLRDSDFWFDFKSVWIWIKESCCKSNTMDLIKLSCLVLAADEENSKSEVVGTKSKVQEEPTFDPVSYARIDIKDGDGENLNGEVDSNDDYADVEESASLNSLKMYSNVNQESDEAVDINISLKFQVNDDRGDMTFEKGCDDNLKVDYANDNIEDYIDKSVDDVIHVHARSKRRDKNSSSKRYGSVNIDDIEDMTDGNDENDSNYVIEGITSSDHLQEHRDERSHNEDNLDKAPAVNISSGKLYGTVDFNDIENLDLDDPSFDELNGSNKSEYIYQFE